MTSIRRRSIKYYFKSKCSYITNSKDFWNAIKPFINDKRCRNESSTIILNENDKMICDVRNVCDIFNDFFADIAIDIGKSRIAIDISCPKSVDLAISTYDNHPSVLTIKQNKKSSDIFYFHEITPEYLSRKIKNLNSKKAAGPDGFPPKLIKMVYNELSHDLCDIINRCIRHNVFPEDMKYADISPLYKKIDILSKIIIGL